MKNFLIKWFVNIITLFMVIHIVAGVSADSWGAIVVAAFILGLLNAFVKPFIILFTLPFTIMTLGFFTLIINAGIFYLASKFVVGFEIINFWSAFWAALAFSVISSILNFILTPKINIARTSFTRNSGRVRPDDDNIIDVEGKVEDKT
ncbi:MAG: phage holin family protein [Candidatus Omnitrophica bacterium]|nr:phage holin family protein [Candidatus Omnitrophota bacterium]